MIPITLQAPTQRPRELLKELGIDALSLEDVVCLILGSGSHGVDVRTCAQAIVAVLHRPRVTLSDLTAIQGVGLARASAIYAALHMPEKIRQAQQEVPVLSCPDELYSACQDIVHKNQEHLLVFYLSSHSTVLRRETITIGTATASLIHPREVFRPAIRHNATAVAVAHNHPSGSLKPSDADLEVTRQLFQAGRILGIEVVDHLICSTRGYTSLKMATPYLFC
jgi:DNA repair protein RadC